MCGLPYFNISGDIPQIPADFPLTSLDMALEISDLFGGSQHTRCEGIAVDTSALFDGENTAGGLFRRSSREIREERATINPDGGCYSWATSLELFETAVCFLQIISI